jgi:hypothetical protein
MEDRKQARHMTGKVMLSAALICIADLDAEITPFHTGIPCYGIPERVIRRDRLALEIRLLLAIQRMNPRSVLPELFDVIYFIGAEALV